MVKSKKLMLVMLSIVLTLSIFVAGCTGTVPGNETETQAPTTATSTTEQAKEDTLVHKTITLALEDDGSVDWTDHELFTMKLLAEAGNMTIDVLPIPQSDRDSKLQTLIASKNLPDLTYNEDENWYWEYAPRIAASLDEHWDKLPIFTEYIKKHPDYYTNFKCYDDKIYGIPQVMDSLGYYSYMWQIRADILEENGMKLDDVRTLDDFYNALKLLKDVKGMAPWIARTGGKQSVFVGRTASAFGSGDKVYWNADSDEYRVGPFDANYKLMIETLAKFYSEGLVHPEIFSMQDQVWEQMKMNEEGFFFIDNWKVRHSPSDVDWDFSIMLPPEVNGTRYYGAEDRPHASPDVKYWVISKDTKALDNILAALNWAFSEDAIMKFNYGIEGESYKMVDGKPMFVWEGGPTPENYYDDIVKPLGLRSGRNSFVTTTEVYLNQVLPGNEFILERAEFYEEKGVVKPPYPVINFTQQEIDRVKQLEVSINTHIDEQISKLIAGIRNISEYDAFVEELKKMGAEELVGIYNTAYGRVK